MFCVPAFHFNLLSASKLTRQLSSNIVFTPTTCLVQDNLRQSLVVLGKEHFGLYYLLNEPYYESKSLPQAAAAQTQRISPYVSNLHLSNVDLWHFRLGHLSFDTMKHIGLPCNNMRQTVSCQVCPRAKLHRQPFPNSTNKACKSFEMLHVDLWGAYKCRTYNGF